MNTPPFQTNLFFSGDEYFDAIVRDIKLAESDIWLESYIFEVDSVGIMILDELENAKKRGVKVHLLVDGIGSYNSLSQIRQECRKREINFRVYHPLPFSVLQTKLSWRTLKWALMMFLRINKRNHRKLVLIDKKIVFVGSLNISNVHSFRAMGPTAWRDAAARIEFQSNTGPQDAVLRACLQTWRSAKPFAIGDLNFLLRRRSLKKPPGYDLFRLNYRLTLRWRLLRDLTGRLKKAQSRILITNAYFIPHRAVLKAILKAARNGVYVGLCIPAKSDVWIVREASRNLYWRLLRAGVHIFEYKPSMLHAKSLIIDDWVSLGSHNLNHRSFFHDLELDVAFSLPELTSQMTSEWKADTEKSKIITLQDLDLRNLWQRALSRVLYWFRYWI